MKKPILVPQVHRDKNRDHGHDPEDESKVDEAIDESFPASDPPSTSVPGSGQPDTKKKRPS